MHIKYQSLFCLKNDDNKEYLAMSSAAVVRLKGFKVKNSCLLMFLLPNVLSE